MKKFAISILLSWVFVFILFFVINNSSYAKLSDAPFSPNSDICGTIVDTHWTVANSPYIVTCNASLNSGTFTIDPGVIVKFQAGTQLDISGILTAEGTESDPILFTSNNANPARGDWNGIKLHAGSGNSSFKYVIVEYGKGIYVNNASPSFDHVTSRFNASSGIELNQCQSTISNSTIFSNTNSVGAGVQIVYGKAIIDSSHIYWNISSNRGGGVYAYGYSSGATVTVTNNIISNNSVADYGGGGILFDSSSGLIANNTIRNNTATAGYGGGGIQVTGATGPTVSVTNNSITNNTANTGGGILTDAYTTITNNLIFSNTANTYGGIYYYYPSSWHGPSNKPITCNSIVNNTGNASGGNGVFVTVNSPFHQNNIYGNAGYQFQNGSASFIDAIQNYWGTSDTDLIEAGIYDKTEYGGLGTVAYFPFLTAADQCAPSVPDIIPPAAITDLTAAPSSTSGQVNLSWTAPGDDGNVGTAMTYTVRYSGSPITTEFGWTGATNVISEPAPQPAGTQQSMTIAGLAPGQTYYFSIRTTDDAGNISNLSNSPGVIDIGFRPNPNGYKFSNFGGNDSDFTKDDMRQMFGDASVCQSGSGPTCNFKLGANKWFEEMNLTNKKGNCDGFTTTSLRFYSEISLNGITYPRDLVSTANTTYDLDFTTTVRRYIVRNWMLAGVDAVAKARKEAMEKTPTQVLEQLKTYMSDPQTRSVNLVIGHLLPDGKFTSHSIAPYAVEEQLNGAWWIQVYDSNYRNANRHVVITPTVDAGNGSWSYNMGGALGVWSGQATDHSIGVFTLSSYLEPPKCSVCSTTSKASTPDGVSLGQVWYEGGGHALITDAQGKQLGFIGNQFLSEIPGAFGSVIPGGLGYPVEPTYYIPLTNTYSILLDGQTLSEVETISVTQLGPGYAASVEGVQLSPDSKDQVNIAPDGTQIVYKPVSSSSLFRGRSATNSTTSVSLALALDGATSSKAVAIQGADIQFGQPITLSIPNDQSLAILDNSQGINGSYDLLVNEIDAGGIYTFTYPAISLNAADTQFLDFSNFTSSGTLTLTVDVGSSGTITQTTILENTYNKTYIYLPFIRR